MNAPETTDCTDFDLTVEALPSGEIIKVEPEFMVNLQDQRVKVGDSLIYSLEARLSSYGHEMTVTMDLSNAKSFASYDDSLNQFKVHGSLLEASDVGNYPISVKATYSNETFSETYTKRFTLTVWNDNEIETETIVEEPWFPEDPIYYPDWEPENYIRSNMTQEEDKERPIPYIIDLSPNGVLLIGWDKKMRPPEIIESIPPTKIAVEAHIDLEEIRFWQKSRSLKSLGDVMKFP